MVATMGQRAVRDYAAAHFWQGCPRVRCSLALGRRGRPAGPSDGPRLACTEPRTALATAARRRAARTLWTVAQRRSSHPPNASAEPALEHRRALSLVEARPTSTGTFPPHHTGDQSRGAP